MKKISKLKIKNKKVSKKALVSKSPYFNFLSFALKMQSKIHAKNNT